MWNDVDTSSHNHVNRHQHKHLHTILGPWMTTVFLLLLSNIFMTFAWYGHLRFRDVSLWKVILVSWLIALPEYALQVPANRIGYGAFSAFELKTIQEVITLTLFIAFSVFYLREEVRWNHILGFVLIIAAVVVVFKKW